MNNEIRFEPGKRYRFTKQKYREYHIAIGEPLEELDESCNSSWVKYADGKEVTINESSALMGQAMGYDENFVGMIGNFVIPAMWCEEIQEDN